MTIMARTDIHRPGSADFDPEGYDCFGVFDLFPEWPDNSRQQVVASLVDQGWSFAGAPHGSGQCSHCGTRIRYAALMGHTATKTLMYVGETCLDNRFSLTKVEFDRLRKEASLNRERMAKRDRIDAFLVDHPDLVWASYAHNIASAGATEVWSLGYGEEEFATREEADAAFAALQDWQQEPGRGYEPLRSYQRGTTWAEKTRMGEKTSTLADMWYRFERYAEMSDNAYAYLVKIVGWLSEAEERRVAREAEVAAKVAAGVQVPAGRITVEGTVLSVKSQDSDYGTTWKMLVQHESGWKVWGTIPGSILDAVDYYSSLKGKTVRFTATVKPSDDDMLFGFYTRPVKGEVL